MFEKLFKLKEHGTTVRTELNAALATFMTMAYIIFVNPSILAAAGMDVPSVTAATCIAAAVATIVMGLYANYPIALAPGMGLNAYFAFTAVPYITEKLKDKGLDLTHTAWQVALAAVFVSGTFFLLITFFKIREKIVNGIPDTIKYATACGIGLFIAFIGLKGAGLVVKSDATAVTLGKLSEPGTLLAIGGIMLTALLMVRKVKGAILIGIIATTIVGMILGYADLPREVVATPSFSATFMKMDFTGLLAIGILDIIFVFMFVDMFDTIGTLIGVGEQGGFIKNGKLPRASQAMTADAVGTMVGAVCGTSTVTSYIESGAGVAEGGKTGLTSLFVGLFFLLALFFTPIAGIIPAYATAPALIIVGILMAGNVAKIKWNDLSDAIPAFFTLIMMPLTYSIATGLALGFILYPLCKLFAGKTKEVSVLVWILAILFVIRFAFLAV